ncbi:hypothetical protein BDV98DRAFT_69160 [Pterulicium gracile]|uniref:Uncharacterized protein n=1 Tax=Pterulicium gracile TaxID=1884261 RepID=A0A5C3QMS1_9AGAR|nr:hypothetical protein BDV98DRAFT_69160 [Pterula gracilis]
MKSLRKERDEALKVAEVCRQRVEQSNISLQKTESTAIVQEEIITQLKRENVQWKDQSRNWQEHFLRVEQERCTMMSRIDELVEETRLANSNNILRRNDGHVTPAPQHNDSALSSTTTKGKSHSAHSRNPPPRLSSPAEAADSRRKSKSRLAATGDETIISARPNRMDHRIDTSNLESTTLAAQVPPLSASSSSSSEAPRQTVMTRRVRATIETTVKEEEDSDTEEQILQAEKDYAEAQRKLVAPTPRSPTKRKAPRKSTYREDEDSDSPVTHRRQLSKRSKVMHSVHDDDDEDDEDGLEPLGGELYDDAARAVHTPPPARSRNVLRATSPPKRISTAQNRGRASGVRAR